MDFDEYDRIDDFELNEILWKSIKGEDAPVPPAAGGDRVPGELNRLLGEQQCTDRPTPWSAAAGLSVLELGLGGMGGPRTGPEPFTPPVRDRSPRRSATPLITGGESGVEVGDHHCEHFRKANSI